MARARLWMLLLLTAGWVFSRWRGGYGRFLRTNSLRAKSALSPGGEGPEQVRGSPGYAVRAPSKRHRGAEKPGSREGEDPLAGMMDDSSRLGDDFLDHRLDATALGRMARRSIGAQQGGLTNHSQ